MLEYDTLNNGDDFVHRCLTRIQGHCHSLIADAITFSNDSTECWIEVECTLSAPLLCRSSVLYDNHAIIVSSIVSFSVVAASKVLVLVLQSAGDIEL
jgi:hypothetical protein